MLVFQIPRSLYQPQSWPNIGLASGYFTNSALGLIFIELIAAP